MNPHLSVIQVFDILLLIRYIAAVTHNESVRLIMHSLEQTDAACPSNASFA
jgi:hypothetical protein